LTGATRNPGHTNRNHANGPARAGILPRHVPTSVHPRIHPKPYPSTTIQQQHPAPHGGVARYPEPIRPSSPRGHSRMRRRRVARVHRHRQAARRPLAAAPCPTRGTGLLRAPHTQRSSKTEPIQRPTSVARTMSSFANAATRAVLRCVKCLSTSASLLISLISCFAFGISLNKSSCHSDQPFNSIHNHLFRARCFFLWSVTPYMSCC
jgi:hypothetical protein